MILPAAWFYNQMAHCGTVDLSHERFISETGFVPRGIYMFLFILIWGVHLANNQCWPLVCQGWIPTKETLIHQALLSKWQVIVGLEIRQPFQYFRKTWLHAVQTMSGNTILLLEGTIWCCSHEHKTHRIACLCEQRHPYDPTWLLKHFFKVCRPCPSQCINRCFFSHGK
jgi:hypothetical protein